MFLGHSILESRTNRLCYRIISHQEIYEIRDFRLIPRTFYLESGKKNILTSLRDSVTEKRTKIRNSDNIFNRFIVNARQDIMRESNKND